jgi:hypothetical protein
MKRIAVFVILVVTTISASAALAQPPTDHGRAVLRLTPSSFDFGKQPIGSTSTAVITISNTSKETVHLCCFSLAFDIRGEIGNMDIEPDPCGVNQPEGIPLQAGQTCTAISFLPADCARPSRV